MAIPTYEELVKASTNSKVAGGHFLDEKPPWIDFRPDETPEFKLISTIYEEDARTNHIQLVQPLYTNAPCSELRLRAAALAGDGYAASLCSGTNSAERDFWLRLAATNGWVPAQRSLAIKYEQTALVLFKFRLSSTGDDLHEVRVSSTGSPTEDLNKAKKDTAVAIFTNAVLVEIVRHSASEIARDAELAKPWRAKAKAALPKLQADADRKDARGMYALSVLHQWGDMGLSNKVLAATLFRSAAEVGLAAAQSRLGDDCVYQTNNVEAAQWYYRAATQGLVSAQCDLHWLHRSPSAYKFDPRFQPRASERARWAFEAAHQASRSDSYFACYDLGDLYESGSGVASNRTEAVRWFRRAAEVGVYGSGGVEYKLALWHFGGDGVPQSDQEGLKWIRLAVQRGHKEDLEYERIMAAGLDSQEGLNYLRKLAVQGEAQSQHNLGDAYFWGIHGAAKNEVEAAKWWRKAADQNDAQAQNGLGICYGNGEGVAKDEVEAVKWWRKAAEQGHIQAQFNLGECYYRGQSVLKDYVEAVRWWRKAAEQNYAVAQVNLGVCYNNGEGVVKDEVESYKWFLLAGAQGQEEAKKGMAVSESRLTREQIAEGQKLARNFKPRDVPASGNDSSGTGIAQSRPKSSGSGFFITADGFLITNNHVVESAAQIRLVTSAGLISAKVVKVDAANDLALLKAQGRFEPLPVVSSRGMKLGGTVATVGFPNIGLQGFAPKLAKGEIASLSGAGDDARYFQISVPVQPGNSGGALVDERGNVVGVVSAKLSARAALAATGALPENVNYAVKSSFLLSFLESVPEVSAKLKEPNTKERKFEDVVKDAQQAAVLVLVY